MDLLHCYAARGWRMELRLLLPLKQLKSSLERKDETEFQKKIILMNQHTALDSIFILEVEKYDTCIVCFHLCAFTKSFCCICGSLPPSTPT